MFVVGIVGGIETASTGRKVFLVCKYRESLFSPWPEIGSPFTNMTPSVDARQEIRETVYRLNVCIDPEVPTCQ
jgi:hypothetical protein